LGVEKREWSLKSEWKSLGRGSGSGRVLGVEKREWSLKSEWKSLGSGKVRGEPPRQRS
jgi:hypothetical protein